MKRTPIPSPASQNRANSDGAADSAELDALLKRKLKGTLPTADALRALHDGQLGLDEAARVRKHILRSARLLAQYAVLARCTTDEARQALLNPAPPSVD